MNFKNPPLIFKCNDRWNLTTHLAAHGNHTRQRPLGRAARAKARATAPPPIPPVPGRAACTCRKLNLLRGKKLVGSKPEKISPRLVGAYNQGLIRAACLCHFTSFFLIEVLLSYKHTLTASSLLNVRFAIVIQFFTDRL